MIEKLRFDKLVTYDSAQPSTQVPKPVIEYVERVVEVPQVLYQAWWNSAGGETQRATKRLSMYLDTSFKYMYIIYIYIFFFF